MLHNFSAELLAKIDTAAAAHGMTLYEPYASHTWCRVYAKGRALFQFATEGKRLTIRSWACGASRENSGTLGRIGMAQDKTAEQIARDIERRLMPEVVTNLAKVEEKEAGLAQRLDGLKATVAPLIAAGFKVKLEKEGTTDQRAIVDYNGPAGRMSATLYGSGSVYLERISLNTEASADKTLLKLAAALG